MTLDVSDVLAVMNETYYYKPRNNIVRSEFTERLYLFLFLSTVCSKALNSEALNLDNPRKESADAHVVCMNGFLWWHFYFLMIPEEL